LQARAFPFLRQQCDKGAYNSISDPETLAQTLTADLRLVSEDKHIHVYIPSLPGSPHKVGDNFEMFIPSGRAVNPLMQSNWEGEGIIPDHLMHEDDALDYALALANKERFNSKVIEVIIGDLTGDLGRLYPFKDVALQCIEHLTTNLEKYKKIEDPEVFVTEINKNLKEISHDEHLRLRFLTPQEAKEADNYDMTCEMLPNTDHVGKIHMRGFGPVKISAAQENVEAGGEARTKEFADSIAKLKDKEVKSVLIDLRENDGGSPESAQLLSSYFMNENVELSSIQNTIGEPGLCKYYTLPKKVIPEENRLLEDIPVYILTSKKTFSAAEKFANDMQILGRATVIGEERTRGGANPGSFPSWSLYTDIKGQSKLLDVCIPNGQTINLDNKKNWEGIGLTPNIVVSSEEDAQEKALELIEKHETSLGSLLPTIQ
jgi:retinol-binding protein 3